MGKAGFNISEHISKFIAQLKRKGLLTPSDLDEAQDYLYSSVDEYMDKGYTDEEAFVLTKHKYGDVLAIQKEYAKVNTTNVIVRWLSIAAGVLVLGAIVGFALTRPNPRKVVLTGKVYRSIDDTLLLNRTVDYFIYDFTEIYIKEDSTFEYILEDDHIQEYELSFKSGFRDMTWFQVTFFSDADTLKFELYPGSESVKNSVKGSRLTDQRYVLNYKTNRIINDPVKDRTKPLSFPRRPDAENKEDYLFMDSVKNNLLLWRQKYFENDPNLLGYYEFYHQVSDLRMYNLDKDLVRKTQEYWSNLYPDHPIRHITDLCFASYYKVEPGQVYIDLPLIDSLDNKTSLGGLIAENEYTLLDIWYQYEKKISPRVAPLKNNLQLVKNQNVHVVGLIAGLRSYEQYKDKRQIYDFPWETYGDVDKNKALASGIPYANGSQVLIDKEGLILAVNPDLDNLTNIINSRIRRQ